MEPKTVLAICRSLHSGSLHFALLTALAARAPHLRFVGRGSPGCCPRCS